jgi:WD40 repeat protein
MRASDLLEAAKPAPGETDLRGFDRLASCSKDGTVKVWDAITGQDLLTLRGHSNSVNSLAFSPDGRRLASSDGKRTIIWGTFDVAPPAVVEARK